MWENWNAILYGGAVDQKKKIGDLLKTILGAIFEEGKLQLHLPIYTIGSLLNYHTVQQKDAIFCLIQSKRPFSDTVPEK